MSPRQLGLGWAEPPPPEASEPLGPGAVVLRGFARAEAGALLEAIEGVVAAAPLRHMVTPGGLPMSVAMTSCGALGWVSDRRGYRYSPTDPESAPPPARAARRQPGAPSERPWPALPPAFLGLARRAAERAGFPGFVPDACLINRYLPGARLSLHQDRDERDLAAPIVSVSLGLPCTFLWGGSTRAERPRRVALAHGDVVVWGGPSRLQFHGVAPLAEGEHPATGGARYNLTLRRAG